MLGAVTQAPSDKRARSPKFGELSSPEEPSPRSTDTSRKVLSESDVRLLGMLRSAMTVAEIARLNYMSERSMYRRIRNLYDTVGVEGRSQLRRSATADHLATLSDLAHLTGVPR
ncbi:hypothetical protein [Nocardia sp. NPDC051463]|uniref:hypothetical protein n=1 Tax=Nocardia sp. NPDC051463 TaxID=3154845 RepID=UPI003418CC7F